MTICIKNVECLFGEIGDGIPQTRYLWENATANSATANSVSVGAAPCGSPVAAATEIRFETVAKIDNSTRPS